MWTEGYDRVHDSTDVHTVWQSAAGKFGKPDIIKAGSSCDREGLVLVLAGNGRGDTVLAHTDVFGGLAVAYRSRGTNTFVPQDGVVPDDSGPGCDDTSTVALADDGSVLVTWPNYHSDADLEPTEVLARRATISK